MYATTYNITNPIETVTHTNLCILKPIEYNMYGCYNCDRESYLLSDGLPPALAISASRESLGAGGGLNLGSLALLLPFTNLP